jgi:hypothetical protein
MLCLLLLVVCCGSNSGRRPLGAEREAASSADGNLRAFVWLPDLSAAMGAKTSQPYQVWAQQQGPGKAEQLVLVADETDGLHLLWSAPRVLEVCYAQAHITGFGNHWAFAADGSTTAAELEVTLRHVERLDDCRAR